MEGPGNQPRSYQFGKFNLIPSEFQLLCNDLPVHLPPKAFEALVVLVKNHGHFLDKDTLTREIWGKTVVGETSLPRIITDLRKALTNASGETPDEREYIETVPKRGYRFIVPVEEVMHHDGEPPVQPIVIPPPPAPAAEKEASATDAWSMAIIASLVVCAVLAQYINEYIPGSWVERYAYLLQLLVIVWAWTLTKRLGGMERFNSTQPLLEEKVREASGYDQKEDWERAKCMAERALKDCKRYWYWLLVSWGLLYIVLAFLRRYPSDTPAFIPESQNFINAIISRVQEAKPSSVDWKDITSDITPAINAAVQQAISPAPIPSKVATLKIFATLFNNCNSLVLALGYMILNKPTVEEQSKGAEEEKRYISQVQWGWGLVIISVVTAVEAAWVIWSPDEVHKAYVIEAFEWISGIGGGVALALYVGRLQSKFLNLPYSILRHRNKRLGAGRLWSELIHLLRRFQHKFPHFLVGLLIIALYCYVAIQPLYTLIGKYPKVVGVVILYVALFLKGLLCYCMIWLFQSGRLLFYFVRVRRTNERVDEEWKDFRLLLE
jgi:DNA-binding winged helix-turn-helix (wHTH) protein